MADTKPLHAAAPTTPLSPTEGDGVSYRGLIWFGIILAVTTIACQLLVWVMFDLFETQHQRTDALRSPLAAPVGALAPPPNLLTDEPGNLTRFHEQEQQTLTTYGWIDRNAGIVRIPIDRAKALVLERGLPTRAAQADSAKVDKTGGRKVGK